MRYVGYMTTEHNIPAPSAPAYAEAHAPVHAPAHAPANTHPHRTRAVWILLATTSLWGLSFPLIKSIAFAHESLLAGNAAAHDSWFITAMAVMPRYVLAVAILLAWVGKDLRTLTRLELQQGVLLGVFAAFGIIFQTDGLQFTSASTSAFLTQMYAVMIPFYTALRQKHLPKLPVWVSSGLVLLGVGILADLDWQTLQLGRGEVETLICSVFFMGQILILERPEYAKPDAPNRVMPVTTVMFIVQLLVFLVLSAVVIPDTQSAVTLLTSAPWMICTGILAIFCTLMALTLMNTWQPKISATEAGLIYCMEPVFASVMALFLPAAFTAFFASFGVALGYTNESITWHLLAGGALITVANVLLQVWRK